VRRAVQDEVIEPAFVVVVEGEHAIGRVGKVIPADPVAGRALLIDRRERAAVIGEDPDRPGCRVRKVIAANTGHR
jgi:hypothetical protein